MNANLTMNKTFQTFRFVSRSFAFMTGIGYLCILVSVVATNLIFYLTDMYDSILTQRTLVSLTAPLDVTAAIFALLTGLVMIITNFKVVLANGVTRKTFWLANLPAALLTALALTVFNQLIVLISGVFLPVQLISDIIYPLDGWFSKMVFQFSSYTFLIVLGWFIALAYYRSSTLMKWVISLVPYFLLRGIIALARSDFPPTQIRMAISHALIGTPARTGLTCLTAAAIIYGLVYLLLRRAPLKG
jgi:hypothetical protein